MIEEDRSGNARARFTRAGASGDACASNGHRARRIFRRYRALGFH